MKEKELRYYMFTASANIVLLFFNRGDNSVFFGGGRTQSGANRQIFLLRQFCSDTDAGYFNVFCR